MTTIAKRLLSVQQQIEQACLKAGRAPASVQLLAVSKTFGPDALRQAFVAGQGAFGENYVQEALDKIAALAELPIEWHCIGPLQANKTRAVAEHFDWVHSIDRLKIAQRLSLQRPAGRAALQVCLQVNIDAAANKAGVAPQQTLALARAVAELPRLRLRGLMTIPEPAPDFAAAYAVHARAKALFDELNQAGLGLDVLSMGMSADLDAAIAAGSTLVRVGSAIFGSRAARLAQPQ